MRCAPPSAASRAPVALARRTWPRTAGARLEWRVGGAGEVALRQYFVEDLAPDAAVAQVRSRLERFAVVGDEKVADALEALAARYEAATEDIAVTPAFLPSDLSGHALPVAARERAKVGLKFEEGLEASTFDGVLRAAGVDAASAARWAAASEGIRHGISNVQAGRGFVTLYRHPEAFGHVDPLVDRALRQYPRQRQRVFKRLRHGPQRLLRARRARERRQADLRLGHRGRWR